MGNGEWEIENGKWEIENGKLIFFFQRLLSISTCYFFTFFARIKGYGNGSHPALFPCFTT